MALKRKVLVIIHSSLGMELLFDGYTGKKALLDSEYAEYMTPGEQEQLTDYSEDGVDLTLIRWMLSLTPAERLDFLQQQVNAILAVRELNAGA